MGRLFNLDDDPAEAEQVEAWLQDTEERRLIEMAEKDEKGFPVSLLAVAVIIVVLIILCVNSTPG